MILRDAMLNHGQQGCAATATEFLAGRRGLPAGRAEPVSFFQFPQQVLDRLGPLFRRIGEIDLRPPAEIPA